jgi:peptidyl-prolyl cis-trans isomerase C
MHTTVADLQLKALRHILGRLGFMGLPAGLLGLSAVLLLGTSCGKPSDPDLLAKVGPREIRVSQFQEQMARRGGANPEALDRPALLQELVEQEALYLKAAQAGLDQDPEVQRAHRNLVISKLRERQLAPLLAKAEVTAPEVQACYETNRARYTRPAGIRLAVLYLKANPAMNADAIAALQQRMAEARQKAREPSAAKPTGFGSLAITYSEDQATRYKGGDVGWIEPERAHAWLSRPVLQAGAALKAPGDLSDVITDPQGVYLLKLLERRDARTLLLSEVEAPLRQQLLAEKRRHIERAFAAEACRSVPVETHPERLATITPPVPGGKPADSQPPGFP